MENLTVKAVINKVSNSKGRAFSIVYKTKAGKMRLNCRFSKKDNTHFSNPHTRVVQVNNSTRKQRHIDFNRVVEIKINKKEYLIG